MTYLPSRYGGDPGNAGALLVASSQAPAEVKLAADYVCNGTDDQVQINAAITSAAQQPTTITDPDDLGGAGHVSLSAGRFNIGSSVELRTGVWLQGQGQLTELFATGLGGTGVVTIVDSDVHYSHITDLWINGNYATGNAHGIHFDASGGGDFSGRPDTNPDSYNTISNILISNCSSSGDRHGIWMQGSSGGSRATKIIGCHIWLTDGYGIYMNGASDCHLSDCTASTNGSGSSSHGFMISAGNTQMIGCKAYYCEGDGFHVTSSRASIIGCVAQDNGNWGFNINGSGDSNIVGGQADSNGRLDNVNGGGIITDSSVTISGMNIFDRSQTPASPQLKGIEITGVQSKCLITARVEVPSGSDHVVNPTNVDGSSNVISIVRSGTTPIQYPAGGGGGGDSTITLPVGASNGSPTNNSLIVRY